MATPFESTPKWFNAEYYLGLKLAQLLEDDPKGEWTHESMLKALAENGFDNPYDHYLTYGDGEGLSPNSLFNNDQYLAAKAAQLGSTWTVDMVAKAIKDAGLTLMQHYEMYGSVEGLSPSSAFNQTKYLEAKLDQLQLAEPDKGWTMDSLKEAFATNGMTPLDHYLAYAKTEGLDKYDYSDNGAPIPHPGNTVALTTGVDIATPDSETLKTSDRDDVITGIVGSSTKGTLNAGDVIDGGAGQDTLVLDMQASFGGFTKGGSVKNVEEIVLKNASNVSFDAKGVEATNFYVVDGSDKGGVTIKNVDSTATGYAVKMEKGDFTAQIVDSALTGKTDMVGVTLNTAGTDAANRANLTVKGVTSGVVEGLSLYAQGKDNFVQVMEGHETVSVRGTGNIDLTLDKAGLKTFDASSATGKVVADLSKAGALLKTINGGDADDTITVAGLVAGAVVDGGDGKDTLKLGTPGAVTLNNTISSVETIEAIAGATDAVVTTINMTNVDGLETFRIAESGTVSGSFVLKGATNYNLLNLEVSNKSVNVGDFVYDGAGELNVLHTGNASGSATSIDSITAANVTTLNISNTADAGTFTIDNLDANKVETIKIDAGDHGVTISDSSKIAALTNIQITGDSAVTLTLDGLAKGFDTINAGELQGNLTVDLSDLTLGDKKMTITGATLDDNTITLTDGKDTVDFFGGTGDNTITGGAGADVINLKGDAAYTVVYAATDATAMVLEGKDTIFGFDAGIAGSDVIQFSKLMLGLASTASAADADFTDLGTASGTLADNKVNKVHLTFTAGSADDVDDVAAALSAATIVAATVSTDVSIIAIDDGSDTYLWYYSAADTTAAISAAELTYIGVLDGVFGPNGLAAGDVYLA